MITIIFNTNNPNNKYLLFCKVKTKLRNFYTTINYQKLFSANISNLYSIYY